MDARPKDIDIAAKGTCEWLLKHNTYTSWACNDGLLWIKGKPGSGKSTLIRYVLSHVGTAPNVRQNDLVLSYFFHGRGTDLQKTSLGLFRSLLYQLRKVPDAVSDVVDAFQQRCQNVGKPGEHWQWHPRELCDFFKSSLQKTLKTRTIWLFVDALDECGERTARNLAKELKLLLEMSRSSESKEFRICFTCRHYPILTMDGVYEICVEDENHVDISTFVHNELSSFRERALPTIPDMITERADGVFLWAQCVARQVLDLDQNGAGPKQIEAVILSVPQELDALYRDLIRDMPPDSRKLIQWICFATRPMSLRELRWALLIEPDCAHRSLYECEEAGDDPLDEAGMKRRVQTLSRGLAEVSSETMIVQFIHQSVKDFFVEKGLFVLDRTHWILHFISQLAVDILIENGAMTPDGTPQISMQTALIGLATATSLVCLSYLTEGPLSVLPGHIFPLPIVLAFISALWHNGAFARGLRDDFLVGTTHYRLSRICIRYLAMVEVDRSRNRNSHDLDTEFPLLNYATVSWPIHAKEGALRKISQHDLLGYFSWPSETLVQLWVRTYRKIAVDSDDCPAEGTRMIHIVSQCGLIRPLQAMIQPANRVGTAIDAKDRDGRAPIWYAAEKGHEAIVKLLLDNGANVDCGDKYAHTPLLWAAAKGHRAIVKLLLDKGVDTETKDVRYRQTPLSWATEAGYEAIVKLLLDKGAKVDTADRYGQTPLSWAVAKGHEVIVKLLLDKAADTETKDVKYGQTPLLWAAAKGYQAIVKLLLGNSAKVNSADKSDRTPLSWAAARGHKAIVKLLLDNGAKVNSADKSDRTPLSWAAAKGHKAIIKLLLDHGADVAYADMYGQTPLLWAVTEGHEAIVKLLLDKGADTEIRDMWYSKTPLLWAVEEGRQAIVKLLLDNGVDTEIKDVKHSQTPLSWATEAGYEAIVKLLLDKGAKVDTADRYGQTPLSWAVAKGHEVIVKLLLDKAADTETKDVKYGQTPLLWAAARGYEVIVRLLLDKGAEVDTADKCGQTPLLWASAKGYEAIVKLLLAKGAVVETADNYGQTPVSWAVAEGHEAIAKLLLDKGSNAKTRNTAYIQTLLLLAAAKGREGIVDLLLDAGASA